MKSTFTANTERFQFKSRKKVEFSGILRPKQQRVSQGELTGTVHGEKASDIEEYFAQALDELGISYQFQYFVPTDYTLPDQEKQVDFVVFTNNRVYPVEVYGSYFHSSSGDVLRDMERERQLNEVFRRWGWQDLIVVWDYEVFDKAAAIQTVRRLFL